MQLFLIICPFVSRECDYYVTGAHRLSVVFVWSGTAKTPRICQRRTDLCDRPRDSHIRQKILYSIYLRIIHEYSNSCIRNEVVMCSSSICTLKSGENGRPGISLVLNLTSHTRRVPRHSRSSETSKLDHEIVLNSGCCQHVR